MHAQKEVVEHIMRNLAFEVEAVPRNKSDHGTSISKSTPLNVKIRVRKKDEDNTQEYVSSTTEHLKGFQKVRLVNSDQTIMNFDVLMEAEFEKQPPPQKIRKQFFDILKPGACLGALNDDDHTYIPTSSYSANIREPSQTTKSDGTLKHKFTLSKNVYQDYTVSTQSGEQKYFFGKCKPGGCLDPPFSEDKYSYQPTMKPEPEKNIAMKSILNKEQAPVTDVVESDTDSNRQPNIPDRKGSKSSGKRGSIFDGTFFKKKRKSIEQSTNTQPPEKKDSVVNIFQGEPSVDSPTTRSNSIITYPPKIASDIKVNDDKVKTRSPSEDKPRKSFNEHSEPYFIPPKGMTRDKDNDKINQNEPKRRSSDNNNEFKMPGFIPIPIPMPITSTKPDPETNTPTDKTSIKPAHGITIPTDNALVKPSPEITTPIDNTLIKPDRQITTPTGSILIKPDREIITPTDKASIKPAHEITTPIDNTLVKPSPEKTTPTDSVLTANDNKPPKQLTSDSKKDSLDNGNSKGTQTPSLKLQDSSTGDTAIDPIQYFKITPLSTTNVAWPPNEKVDTESKSSGTVLDLQNNKSKELSLNISKDSSFEKPESMDHNVFLRTGNMPDEYDSGEDIIPQSSNNSEAELNKDKYVVETVHKNDCPVSKDKINDNEPKVKPNEEDSKQTDFEQNAPVTEYPKTSSEDNGSIDTKRPLQIDTSNRKPRKSITEDINIEPRFSLPDNLDKSGDSEIGLDESKINKPGVLENATDKTKSPENTSPGEPNFESKKDKDDKFVRGDDKGNIEAPYIIKEITTPPVRESNNKTGLMGDNREHSKDNVIDPFPANIPPKIPKIPKLVQDHIKHSIQSDEKLGRKPVIHESKESAESISSFKNNETMYSPEVYVLPVNVDNNNVEIFAKTLTDTTDSNDNLRNIITERAQTSISPANQSPNTVKSALKKDSISVELGFFSHLNKRNERVLTTFDTKHVPKRSQNDLVTIIKSQIKISSNEIRIPVDAEHDMSIQIKKPSQRVSISESGMAIVTDNGKVIKQKPIDPSAADGGTSSSKMRKYDEATKNSELDISILEFYEQELIPLQLIIRSLKDEIDVLAAQQLVFRDKIFCPNKTKPRTVHSNKKCSGCLKKYY